jgi:hypothetical protein
MKDLNDLRDLTIYEIFVRALGKDKADEFFELLQQAIKEGKKGDDLKEFIYKLLCKLSVSDNDVYQLSYILQKQVSPGK